MIFNHILFIVVLFLFFLSIFVIIFLKRASIVQFFVVWFNQNIEKTERTLGAYRDKATLFFTATVMMYGVVPLVVFAWTANIFYTAMAVVLAYKIPLIIQDMRHRRRLHAIEQELPVTLAMFASALSGGVSLTIAIQTYTRESKTPLSTEFAYLNRLQRLGVDFDDALEQVSKRVGLADFDLVVLAMRISKAVGGNLSETLLTLGQSIQQKLMIEGKIKALTSQGVMQAWVMSLLPALVAFALTLIQPDQMDKLFNTNAGQVVLLVCCILDYIGFKIIKKILSIDV